MPRGRKPIKTEITRKDIAKLADKNDYRSFSSAYTTINFSATNQPTKVNIMTLIRKHLEKHPDRLNFGCSVDMTLNEIADQMAFYPRDVECRVFMKSGFPAAVCLVWFDGKYVRIDCCEAHSEAFDWNKIVLVATTIEHLQERYPSKHALIDLDDNDRKILMTLMKNVEKDTECKHFCRVLIGSASGYRVREKLVADRATYSECANSDHHIARRIEEAYGKIVPKQNKKQNEK